MWLSETTKKIRHTHTHVHHHVYSVYKCVGRKTEKLPNTRTEDEKSIGKQNKRENATSQMKRSRFIAKYVADAT